MFQKSNYDPPITDPGSTSTFVVNNFELGSVLLGLVEDGGVVEQMEVVDRHHELWRLAVRWPRKRELT